MWQYLIFNGVWAAAFILAYIRRGTQNKFWVRLVLTAVLAWAVAGSPVDPFGAFFYYFFALALLESSASFRMWSTVKTQALTERLDFMESKLSAERNLLEAESSKVAVLEGQFAEISHLYEKIKEMSQSYFLEEVFLICCEALDKHTDFHEAKLYLFNPDGSPFQKAEFVFGLNRPEIEQLADRSAYLRDPAKVRKDPNSFEEKICQTILERPEPLRSFESDERFERSGLKLWPDFRTFEAYPLIIDGRVHAVLMVMDVGLKPVRNLPILVEHFTSEYERIFLYRQIQKLAITDGLTGAYVRRHLWERLEGEVERSKKFGLKLSFLMIDVDHFKSFNDDYGHLVGDVVLRKTADTIRDNIRELDLLGRYGGEEFAVILIETNESDAFLVAERIRQAVAAQIYEAYEERLKVTVSIGCATFYKNIPAPSDIIEAADKALYQAKSQGRNRVCLHDTTVN